MSRRVQRGDSPSIFRYIVVGRLWGGQSKAADLGVHSGSLLDFATGDRSFITPGSILSTQKTHFWIWSCRRESLKIYYNNRIFLERRLSYEIESRLDIKHTYSTFETASRVSSGVSMEAWFYIHLSGENVHHTLFVALPAAAKGHTFVGSYSTLSLVLLRFLFGGKVQLSIMQRFGGLAYLLW